MSTFRLGIAGGCLSTGFGLISLSKVYHRILAKRVEAAAGIKLRVHLASLESHDPTVHLQAVDKLLCKRGVDALIYQARPEFLWLLSTWIWKLRDGSGIRSVRLNSCRRSEEGWKIGQASCRPVGKLRSLNWFMGGLTGCRPVGWDYISDILREIHEKCLSHGVQLCVMGPIAGDWYIERFRKHMDAKLHEIVNAQQIAYLDLESAFARSAEAVWFDDGQHLNEQGHALIAKTALPLALDWVADTSPQTAESER